MTELKDKDEQYSIFLKYKEDKEYGESKLVITLRVIFVSFFLVVLTFFIIFIVNNYNELSTIIESFTDTKLLGVKSDKKPALQSFDDDFVFIGAKVQIRQQIGNAVPPLMAKAIADKIYEEIGE